MAKTTITFSCGHTASYTGRNRAECSRRERSAAAETCWNCSVAAENAATLEAAEQVGLPVLVGTERQIAYGTTQRHHSLLALDLALVKLRATLARSENSSARAEFSDALILIEDEVRRNTSAKFWIELQAFTVEAWSSWIWQECDQRGITPLMTAARAARAA